MVGKKWALALAIVIGVTILTVTLLQAQGTSVSVHCIGTATRGTGFLATVNIDNVDNLDACNYDITYDSSVLQLIAVTDGMVNGVIVPVDIWREISPGTVRVVQNIPGLSGTSGSGYLAELSFVVVGVLGSSSSITISNGILSSTLATKIDTAWNGTIVRIYLQGDANQDGIVTVLDITKVERIVVGLDLFVLEADANGDEQVNALDLTVIERLIIGV